jgi:electron transfer flavoprotein alpha subunit
MRATGTRFVGLLVPCASSSRVVSMIRGTEKFRGKKQFHGSVSKTRKKAHFMGQWGAEVGCSRGAYENSFCPRHKKICD